MADNDTIDRVAFWMRDHLIQGWLHATRPEPGDSVAVIRQLAGSHALALAMREQLREDIASLTDEECEEVRARIRQASPDRRPGVIDSAP
jgi:hypothetical protein